MKNINLNKAENNEEFNEIIKELVENKTVNKMKKYIQHYDTSCFEHCYNASYYCYSIAKKLKWDYKSVARAAMLHDLFLYDWRKPNHYKGFHAFKHGKIACHRASKLFDLTDKEKDIITKHMFPVILIPPKYKEGFLLTIIDKYCTILEMKKYIHNKCFAKKAVI